MCSYGAISLSTSSRLRGYIISWRERRNLGWCQTCLTPIGIGKTDIFFFCLGDGLGVPSRRVGDDALWFWQYLGHRQRFRFGTVFSFAFSLLISLQVFNVIYFPHFSACVRPLIIDEQEAFIHRVLEIPIDERRCRDLITLDTLHAYCGGFEPMLAYHRLNAYSRRRKFVHLSLFFIVFSCISLSKSITFPL